jgi:hypothetical protein
MHAVAISWAQFVAGAPHGRIIQTHLLERTPRLAPQGLLLIGIRGARV